MSRISIVISIFFIAPFCFSQQDTTRLDNWKSYIVPTHPDTLSHYNWSDNNWIVYENDGRIHANLMGHTPVESEIPFQIKPLDENEKRKMRGSRTILKVDDGYLVGFWRGEWGGCLYWFGNDGQQHYQVSLDMVVQFLERDNRIFAIEGLAHLSMSEGSIIEIKKVNNKWATTEYLKLPFAPYAADLDSKNNFVIITSDNLLSVDKNKKIDTLIKQGFWSVLYPTSMIIKTDIAFVGMRHGVFKINLLTHKQDWLMRD